MLCTTCAYNLKRLIFPLLQSCQDSQAASQPRSSEASQPRSSETSQPRSSETQFAARRSDSQVSAWRSRASTLRERSGASRERASSQRQGCPRRNGEMEAKEQWAKIPRVIHYIETLQREVVHAEKPSFLRLSRRHQCI